MSQLENCPPITVWSDIRSGTLWEILSCVPHPTHHIVIMVVGSWLEMILSMLYLSTSFYAYSSSYWHRTSPRMPAKTDHVLSVFIVFIKEQNKNLIKYTIVNHLGKNIWVGIRRLYRDKKICLGVQKQWGAIPPATWR